MTACPTAPEPTLCACGCGQETPIATRSRAAIGHVKGQPLRFINGHNRPELEPRLTLFDDPARRIDFTHDAGYETPCWRWTGRLNTQGYGAVLTPAGKVLAVHRLIYERLRGDIPAGLQIDHLCRNRACCNPAHLEPVTQAENLRRGERVKLTHADVAAIRASDLSNMALAQRYGVHAAHISKVRSGRRWA